MNEEKSNFAPGVFNFNLMATNNDDFGMSPVIANNKSQSPSTQNNVSANPDGTFNNQVKKRHVFVSQGSGFADAIKSIQDMKGNGMGVLPNFNR